MCDSVREKGRERERAAAFLPGCVHMCDSVREKGRERAVVVKLWCSAPPKQLRWSSLLCSSFTWVVLFVGCCLLLVVLQNPKLLVLCVMVPPPLLQSYGVAS
jgi:hypothetical protein